MDLAASIQAVTEEVVLRLARAVRTPRPARRTSAWPAAWRSTAWPTARCCATGRSSTSGSSPQPATPAGRWARRSPPSTCFRGQPRDAIGGWTAWRGAYLGPEFPAAEIEQRLPRRRAPASPCCATTQLLDATAAGAGRGKAVGLVPGPDGVRPPRPRRPLASWATPARPRCSRCSTSRSSTARVFRPVRPGGAARGRGRLVRARPATAPTCCWWPTSAKQLPPRR